MTTLKAKHANARHANSLLVPSGNVEADFFVVRDCASERTNLGAQYASYVCSICVNPLTPDVSPSTSQCIGLVVY